MITISSFLGRVPVIALIILIRILFVLFFPLSSYDFFPNDSREYVELADRALTGNFDFDIGRFIRSPLYPLFITLHKLVFAGYWEFALISSQVVLSVITGVFICRISRILFESSTIEGLTGIIYAIYLPTFYYLYSFTSETLYMFLNVGCMYYFINILYSASYRNIIAYAVFFSLAYLTRGEILLFLPFALLIIAWVYRNSKRTIGKIYLSLAVVWFLITLPWAITNTQLHGMYLTSSNGGKYVFYLSNSELGYADGVKIPSIGSKGHHALLNDYNFFNPDYDSLMRLPTTLKQDAFFKSSLEWIRNNPVRFMKIKLWNAINFFSPGLTIGHHSVKTWALMFFITGPFHLLFFVGLFLAIRHSSVSHHFWIIGYLLSSIIFLTLFLYTARFRAYSIEVFYLIYAAYALGYLFRKAGLLDVDFRKANHLQSRSSTNPGY
jgi:4-amino-4-deoxy-L-arabinose transferase-like glycosyltransferase